MIDAKRITNDEVLAMDVAYEWEKLRESIGHVLCQIDDSRADTKKLTGSRQTPEFDNLESLLMSVHNYISGQIEELMPGWHKREQELRFRALPEERKLLDTALAEGINAVAFARLCTWERTEAIEYIRTHGLASMNYEASCRGVCEYEEARRNAIREQEAMNWNRKY